MQRMPVCLMRSSENIDEVWSRLAEDASHVNILTKITGMQLGRMH